MTIDESNWLDSKVIECHQCGQKLHWLWHSPFYDEIFFYCTQCPKRVEVSGYDKFVLKLRKAASEKAEAEGEEKWFRRFYSLIEEKLADCECGGSFKYDAPRRCLRCFTVLAQSEPGRDVWPPEEVGEKVSLGYQSLSSPAESLIKTENIWRP
jgi:hypothetical protein